MPWCPAIFLAWTPQKAQALILPIIGIVGLLAGFWWFLSDDDDEAESVSDSAQAEVQGPANSNSPLECVNEYTEFDNDEFNEVVVETVTRDGLEVPVVRITATDPASSLLETSGSVTHTFSLYLKDGQWCPYERIWSSRTGVDLTEDACRISPPEDLSDCRSWRRYCDGSILTVENTEDMIRITRSGEHTFSKPIQLLKQTESMPQNQDALSLRPNSEDQMELIRPGAAIAVFQSRCPHGGPGRSQIGSPIRLPRPGEGNQ